ncbi:DUF4097 family beta strand repeat-containing protein [Halalkalibacillus halophilus]|uniref:DUF4097 family beta strand repeat-containing protein n=1 Tax=Halalkalibacillus halophilus TaxID=392827 RepID=UPI00041BC715|nr:DUF4097 family beta strand repeat-containing protein [Halalkalibacillus halophilus]
MSEERMKILSLLEEGHITAEEADKLLHALDQQHTKSDSSTESTNKNYETEQDSQDSSTSFTKELKNFTEGVFHFIDDTFQRVKEGPFEFNFSHMHVKRTFTYDGRNVENLNIDVANSMITFLPTTEQEIKVQCKGKVYKESDQQRAEEVFDESVRVSVNENTLQIEQDRKQVSVQLTIYLPKKVYENAYIKTINGSIQTNDLHMNQARVATVNGSVTISGYEGDALYVDTKHGSVRLEDAVIGKSKVDTSTGSIFFDGSVEQLNMNVTTGSIRTYIRNADARHADLHATTGSIQLYVPNQTPINGTANTTVSNVKVDLPFATVTQLDDQFMKKLVQFHYKEEGKETFDVDLSTKTGSIRIYTI